MLPFVLKRTKTCGICTISFKKFVTFLGELTELSHLHFDLVREMKCAPLLFGEYVYRTSAQLSISVMVIGVWFRRQLLDR